VDRIFVGISREPISSANPKFKIKNPRVSASRPWQPWREQSVSQSPITNLPFRPLRPLREQSAFTLVELLAVVGIMGLLAAVGVPALKGLTGSGGRKQALNQVISALEIARNTAISTGTNAAVIFPHDGFTASGVDPTPYKFRSMAIVSYFDTTIATNTNSNISYEKLVSSWIVLPQGISFLPAYLKTNTTTNMISVTAKIRIPPKTSDITITCPGIIFQSDGGLLEETNSIPLAGVAFFEGTVTGTTTNPTSKMTNFETVRLTRYTGRTIPTLAPAP
jgi:prepilin-type N-terminal cleavage/methylation domain-containing protein